MTISKLPLPDNALLGVYSHGGGYTDCYTVDLHGKISFERYVAAFYTTWVFKLERFILKWAVNKPSTDEQTQALTNGSINAFAAWTVEKRAPNQLLMCDFMGRTRSWLMVAALNGGAATRLYFGSAVVPKKSRDGRLKMGWPFRALLGFHQLYSRILLRAAAKRLG